MNMSDVIAKAKEAAEKAAAEKAGQTNPGAQIPNIPRPGPIPNTNVLSRAEVEAIIDNMARQKNMQHARWSASIVDLMAVLGMNSSLGARAALAAKLGYSGRDPDGSAEKNLWIHAELLKVLAQNGGRVPSNLF
jgi:pyruvate/2-oxoglutarate dehydrogenase complex dihydrolipoamide acyltransferase (E2) component